MMCHKLALFLTFTTAAFATRQRRQTTSQSVWNVNNFQNLISFGDSYTDENRLTYITSHNGTLPANNTFFPESFDTPGGGRTWPRYVVQYTGNTVNNQWTPHLTLYDYAVSGAVCSNLITPRTISASLPGVIFPSVLEYEVPTYRSDLNATRNGTTSTPYFTTPPNSTNSVYTMWIGTNDLGVNAFLTDSQVRGKTLTDYTSCIYSAFDGLYASGARVFVLFNNAPLDLTPLYANSTLNGTTATTSEYWPYKPANATGPAEVIREYVTTVNTVFRYQTPFEARVSNRYPGASFAVFDVHSLIGDIYRNPGMYLNGTQPANVTSPEHQCVNMTCVDAFGGMSPDSFLWYDALHPSEQTDRIIARNFVQVMNGTSQYATYW